MMLPVFTGLVAGVFHVLSGPDHLAAIAPLAAESQREPWRIGMRWGVGHAGGVALVGILALLFREIIPIEIISSWSERLVGMMLIGIGLWGFRKAFRHRLHAHPHQHGGDSHLHVHAHSRAEAHHVHEHGSRHDHIHAALAVGTLHGLAGSSHFLGVVPALAFPTTSQALAYLSAYGLGTVLAMTLFASLIGWTTRGVDRRGQLSYQRWLGFCSALAILVGIYWLMSA